MKVLICGSRHMTNIAKMRTVVGGLGPGDVVIHGGAPGADTLAGAEAERRGLKVEVFPADWGRYGRAAGPRRNQQMIEEKPDVVIAFLAKGSRGTRDTIRRAKAARIPVVVHELD